MEKSKTLNAAQKEERDAQQEMLVKTVIVPGSVLPTPRPGKSLADLGGEKPLYFLKLWFEERVGLPKLFDWFVSLSSIILGISMYLHTRQIELLTVGRFAAWFDPIKISLIVAGFGLILADMIQEEYLRYRNLSNYFRLVLFVAYGGLATILYVGGDIDGFLIHGLFALTILVEAVMGVRSSTVYMLYIQGLLLGTALIFYVYPADAGLSAIATILFAILDGHRWVWIAVVATFMMVTLYGFVWEKRVLKTSSSICGILMVLLAIYYANNNYWSRSFFLLISGMVGVILPFWEQFKLRFQVDRPLVFRMFGTILMAFALVVLIIGVVQSILMKDANLNLSEKSEYGKILTERTIQNIFSTLDGVASNPTFVTAVIKNDVVTIDGFSKSIFKNNSDLGEVITINPAGKPLSSYPYSADIMNANFGAEVFFRNGLSQVRYFSRTVEQFPGVSKNSIIFATAIVGLDNKVIGVLVAPINVSSLSDRLSEIVTMEQSVSVVDENGRFIVSQDPQLLGERVLETDATSLLWSKPIAAEIGYDVYGKFSLFRSSKSNDVGWTVVVSQPVFSILEISKSGLVLVLILLALTTTIVSFSFVFASSRSIQKYT